MTTMSSDVFESRSGAFDATTRVCLFGGPEGSGFIVVTPAGAKPDVLIAYPSFSEAVDEFLESRSVLINPVLFGEKIVEPPEFVNDREVVNWIRLPAVAGRANAFLVICNAGTSFMVWTVWPTQDGSWVGESGQPAITREAAYELMTLRAAEYGINLEEGTS